MVQLIALHCEFTPMRQIATSLGPPSGAVEGFLRRPNCPPAPLIHKNNRKVSATLVRSLFLAGLDSDKKAAPLHFELYIPIGKRCIQQIVSNAPYLKYKKMVTAPRITSQHRRESLKWYRRFIMKGDAFWFQTVFSEDEKFN